MARGLWGYDITTTQPLATVCGERKKKVKKKNEPKNQEYSLGMCGQEGKLLCPFVDIFCFFFWKTWLY